MGMRALIVLAFMQVAVAHADPPRRCVEPHLKEHIRELTVKGADEWLIAHTGKLIDNWLKDYGDPAKRRATLGMGNSIEAYQMARHDAQLWDPPDCE